MNNMKKTATVFKIIIPLIIIAAACNNNSSNLIFNGSAEIPNYDSVPEGWQNIQGKWVSAEGDSAHHDYAHAQDSSHYFFAGNGSICVLQQDADVSKYAKAIDNNKQKFILSGYEQTLNQGNISDQGMLKVECLDASKTKTLYSDSTDTLMSKTKWQAVTDTFSAPPNTRFIRVQLVSFRNVGGDNDGYFDNISLTTTTSKNSLLIIIIIAALIILVVLYLYFRKRKSNNQTKIKNK